MHKTRLSILLLMSGTALFAMIGTRCTQQGGEQTPTPVTARDIEIVATEYALTPNRINATPGEALKIILRNQGTLAHRIRFDFPTQTLEIEQGVDPGGSAQLTFSTPQEPGDYVYYDPTNNYRALGMEGILTVSTAKAR